MRNRTVFMSFALLALFLALAPAASARNTWYVDGVNGSDSNDCKSSVTACKTIGHAISLCSSGDTIMVAPATYTENLTINISLRIIGSGATTTIVDGNQAGSVFAISNSAADVLLSRLTIRNGNAQYGGGILSWGTLTVNYSTISANSAQYDGGGIAIFSFSTATINNSTLSANSASSVECGGGVVSWGALTVNRSTLSANSNDGVCSGGTLAINRSTLSGNPNGITMFSGTATINSSTISGNSNVGANIYGGSTATINNSTFSGNSYDGTVVFDGGTATINNSTISGNSQFGVLQPEGGSVILQNSIVANNSGGNCSGTITSNGYNLSSDNTCNFNGPGDMNSTNPKLGTLGNYGGPTQTIPLLEGSRAIDAGNPNGCTDGSGNLLTTDQRGKPRPDPEDTGGCDIGAYERQQD